jgi:hypothetical protein
MNVSVVQSVWSKREWQPSSGRGGLPQRREPSSHIVQDGVEHRIGPPPELEQPGVGGHGRLPLAQPLLQLGEALGGPPELDGIGLVAPEPRRREVALVGACRLPGASGRLKRTPQVG